MPELTDFRVLTFDCYGTLIDWESGMIEALGPLTERAGRAGRPLSRDEVLEAHARQESFQQGQTPGMRYGRLLAVVYKRLAEQWGVPAAWAECEAYGRSVGDWPAFPDSAEALRYLKRHYALAILSNVDNESFQASKERLGVELDAIYTAEDIGSYKPAGRNFEYMVTKLGERGFARQDLLHVAESLYHDHAPANRLGLASCWIHRRHDQEGFGATVDPGERPAYDFRFTSMAALAEAHREAVGG